MSSVPVALASRQQAYSFTRGAQLKKDKKSKKDKKKRLQPYRFRQKLSPDMLQPKTIEYMKLLQSGMMQQKVIPQAATQQPTRIIGGGVAPTQGVSRFDMEKYKMEAEQQARREERVYQTKREERMAERELEREEKAAEREDNRLREAQAREDNLHEMHNIRMVALSDRDYNRETTRSRTEFERQQNIRENEQQHELLRSREQNNFTASMQGREMADRRESRQHENERLRANNEHSVAIQQLRDAAAERTQEQQASSAIDSQRQREEHERSMKQDEFEHALRIKDKDDDLARITLENQNQANLRTHWQNLQPNNPLIQDVMATMLIEGPLRKLYEEIGIENIEGELDIFRAARNDRSRTYREVEKDVIEAKKNNSAIPSIEELSSKPQKYMDSPDSQISAFAERLSNLESTYETRISKLTGNIEAISNGVEKFKQEELQKQSGILEKFEQLDSEVRNGTEEQKRIAQAGIDEMRSTLSKTENDLLSRISEVHQHAEGLTEKALELEQTIQTLPDDEFKQGLRNELANITSVQENFTQNQEDTLARLEKIYTQLGGEDATYMRDLSASIEDTAGKLSGLMGDVAINRNDLLSSTGSLSRQVQGLENRELQSLTLSNANHINNIQKQLSESTVLLPRAITGDPNYTEIIEKAPIFNNTILNLANQYDERIANERKQLEQAINNHRYNDQNLPIDDNGVILNNPRDTEQEKHIFLARAEPTITAYTTLHNLGITAPEVLESEEYRTSLFNNHENVQHMLNEYIAKFN